MATYLSWESPAIAHEAPAVATGMATLSNTLLDQGACCDPEAQPQAEETVSPEHSPTPPPHCRICHCGATEESALLPNLCGCKAARVHLKCLETWIHYSAARRDNVAPTCEVCLQTYNLPQHSSVRARRVEERRFVVGEQEHDCQTLSAATSFPLVAAAGYGFCHDILVAQKGVTNAEVAVVGNALVVLLWVVCVVQPARMRRVRSRTSAMLDSLSLATCYTGFMGGWLLQNVLVPHPPSHPRSGIMHVINIMILLVCVAVRLTLAC